jgi:PhoH-like ATPase
LIDFESEIFGIKPRNVEQVFSLDALLNPDIPFVTLVGKAGTGKTLLALAAGLYCVQVEKLYNKLLVSKPVIPMGKDIGYIPGDIEEKMRPWLQPIYDNLDLLFKGSGKKPEEYLAKKDLLEIEVLSYIRGRTIPNQYMIVDEAQNLTPAEVKTILTRVGEGTKIVLTGDPYQIDNPYLDSSSNGLVYTASKFKDNPLSANITMKKGERSELATVSSEIL